MVDILTEDCQDAGLNAITTPLIGFKPPRYGPLLSTVVNPLQIAASSLVDGVKGIPRIVLNVIF